MEIKIEINNKIARRAKAAAGFKVLGTQITFDNNYEVELESRLMKADKAFWANWGLLGCISVPLEKRLAIFTSAVNATMLWCAGTWNLTRAQNEKIRVRQMRLIRRMLRLKRREGELMGDFLHRANGILKEKLNTMGIAFETWDIQATQLRFVWDGHVARMRINDPDRPTYRVLKHWDYGLIVSKIELHHHGRQCHNRHLHIWRWEYNMYRFIGLKWRGLAYGRDAWKEKKVYVAQFKATKGNISL